MIKQISLFCLSFFFAVALAASPEVNDPLIVRTSTDDNSSIQLHLANLEGMTTTIKLSSLETKDVILEKQLRKHNGFGYNLNLEELSHGRYLLVVTKGKEVRQQVILINENGIFLSQIK